MTIIRRKKYAIFELDQKIMVYKNIISTSKILVHRFLLFSYKYQFMDVYRTASEHFNANFF